jgi:G:T-mismatch repair DNA endonuclease (very short patch repair protein)
MGEIREARKESTNTPTLSDNSFAAEIDANVARDKRVVRILRQECWSILTMRNGKFQKLQPAKQILRELKSCDSQIIAFADAQFALSIACQQF